MGIKNWFVKGAIVGTLAGAPSGCNTSGHNGTLKEKTEIKESAEAKRAREMERRFRDFADTILGLEGGYHLEKHVDKNGGGFSIPTNMGITPIALKNFRQKHGKEDFAKDFPTHVKDLNKEQAVLIMRKDFYEAQHLDKIDNESVAGMLLDISYNYGPAGFNRLVRYGTESVFKDSKSHFNAKGKELGRSKDMLERVTFINSLSETDLKIFYDAVAKKRYDEASRNKRFRGLKDRAETFVDRFVPSSETSGEKVAYFDARARMKMRQGRG